MKKKSKGDTSLMNLPTFKYEKQLCKKGYKYIGGVDEVGRGCFAGPVVAAAVTFAPNSNFQLPFSNKKGKKVIINDSKKMTPRQRKVSAKWIKKNCLAWGIGKASAVTINRVGMVKATGMAFREAIKMTNEKLKNIHIDSRFRGKDRRIDYLLIDAFYIPYVKGLRRRNQKAIVKGDAKSISIAAASIVAKVYRDALMEKIGKRARYNKYDWVSNKGYGTKKHLSAIEKYGTNGYHRRQFVETYLKKTAFQ